MVIGELQMGKVGETPGVAAPINPKYMYFNVTQITFSQITAFFRHELIVIGVSLLYNLT